MKGFLKYRTGQQLNIASIGTIALLFVAAAIILGLGGTILSKIQDTQTDKFTTALINQSFTWLGNDTAEPFNQIRVDTSSVVVYCNVTLLTLSTNYTVNSSGVAILNLSNATSGMGHNIQLCAFNMTFGWNYGSHAYNSSGFGLVGVHTTASFIPTLAVIAMAAIVIGILMLFFGRPKEKT